MLKSIKFINKYNLKKLLINKEMKIAIIILTNLFLIFLSYMIGFIFRFFLEDFDMAKVIFLYKKHIPDIIAVASIYIILLFLFKQYKNIWNLSDDKQKVDIDVDDLLGREAINLDKDGISDYLTNKVVLVTGGGGSIGSELCRQIARFNPKHLIIFDIYENNAYDIQNELKRNYHELSLHTLIGSVRDRKRLREVYSKYRPDVVFHAAAHKHVPLMEDSPAEAIKNNVVGTFNVAEMANNFGVEKFVLISTDKAVNPTNIMGATKRLCEMIVQAFDKNSDTEFVAVRFGNVLGSNGSVVPLFKRQIAAGGPVTLTHKDITRYFMTIPEAAQLVLQAGAYAEGGEIFVLDMGKPVKIYDLAEKLIKLSGFEPNKDIKIEITGLRPGEKLYEELLMDEEGLKETKHKKIFIGKPGEYDLDKIINKVAELIKVADLNNKYLLKEKMKQIVTTYKEPDEVNKEVEKRSSRATV